MSNRPAEPDTSERARAMPTNRWRRIQEVFAAAVALPPADRAALLDRVCSREPGVRAEVESLLEAHEKPGALDRLADDMSPAIARVRPATDSIRTRVISHYCVGAPLGAGGMGVVYRARDDRLGRDVALKFLPAHLGADETAKHRLLLEARAAAALDHPNVCTVHEIGETPDGQLFIVMPLYAGETLQERLTRGALTVEQALAITREVALGVSAAHRVGIVHRDIKPSNIMLLGDGRLKILDFGIAKVDDGTITAPGTRLGTVAYMSPEQLRGEAVDQRTDIWSLGVVLYEMLAGRRPFDGDAHAAVIHAILNREPEALATIRADVSPSLNGVVKTALAKQPERRFARMADLLSALDGAAMPAVGEDVTDDTPAVAERRRIAVLVTVLADRASLVERLDAAELDELTARLHAEADDVARRYGGLVNGALDDEIVSLFGIPVGHEDDDLRAVRAALDLHARARGIESDATRRLGVTIALQSGIHAGPVIAQRLRHGPRRYAITGSAMQVAARLSSLSSRDEILITDECRRLVMPFVETEGGRPVELSASSPPSMRYRVVGESGLSTRLEAAEHAGLTPYAGRVAELARLEEAVARARGGEGRLVLLIGEAGAGKSRLLHELRTRVRPSGVQILQGRCRSYGGVSPYLPFVEVLRDALGPLTNAGANEAAAAAATILAIDRSLEPFVPLYLHLLSIHDAGFALPRHLQGEHLHAALLDALTAIIMLAGQRSPLLLFLEDWHWADAASREAARRLAGVIDSTAVAAFVTSRPDAATLAELGGQSTTIQIEPLDRRESLAVMCSVFHADRAADDLAEHVYERTGGNPLFIEQVACTLREAGDVTVSNGVAQAAAGADSLRIPDTVQAVIRARLDRLDPETRELLRVASVIGREFSATLLAASAGVDPTRALDRLRAGGLVQQTRILPEATYRFKHVLTHEVAYASLVEHQRKALHGAVGRALEMQAGERPEAWAETLAHHFGQAEIWERAIEYGRQAAERLRSLSQYGEALAMVERVRQWVPRLADAGLRRETTAGVLLAQERLCETLGQRGRQQEIISELVTLLAPGGSPARLAEAYLRQGDLLTLLKRFDAADRALATALRLGRESGDAAFERNALRSIGLLRWHEGRHREALEITESALAIDRERRDDVAVAGDLANLANVLLSLGQHERARTALEEAIAMPALAADPMKMAYVLHNLANTYRSSGDLEPALEHLQRAYEITRANLLPIQGSFHLTSIAHIRVRQGRSEDALRTYAEAVELSRRARHAEGLAQSLHALGELEFGLGRDDDAVAHLREAAALFAQLEDEGAQAQAWQHLGRLHERKGDWREAGEAWQAARVLAARQGDRRGELAALEGLARTARRLRAADTEVGARFEEALAAAVALGDQSRQIALLNTLGILHWERGRFARALDLYESALRLCREAGDRTDEGLMLNSVGVTLARLQRYEEARTALESAVALNRANGERLLEAHGLAALGDVSSRLGRPGAARENYERSLDLRRQVGDAAGADAMTSRLAQLDAGRARTGD